MKKALAVLLILGVAGGVIGWLLSAADRLPESVMAELQPADAANGETLFWAGGCASCHAAPGAKGDDKLLLSGGVKLESPFGTFIAPNISSSENDGIGRWSLQEFAQAMLKGTSPNGENYYPAFPYTSYARMKPQDVADLFAFMQTLPAVEGRAPDHELGFPFNIRRSVGLWKRLFLNPAPVIPSPPSDTVDYALWEQGRYLVEGPAHCSECHTGRNAIGGLVTGEWLAGAAAPSGEGKIPNITNTEAGIGSWSTADIAYYLETGFTPDYDSVGGEMVSVQENMAKLTAEDRQAIAVYLKSVQ